jgi:hypothetical protein
MYMSARNKFVTDSIQKAYVAKVPKGQQFEVFCVSNKIYEKYGQSSQTNMVKASGVPALRAYCHNIMADLQLKAAQKYLTLDLPSLLNSLENWIENWSGRLALPEAKLKEQLYEFVDSMEQQVCFQSRKFFQYNTEGGNRSNAQSIALVLDVAKSLSATWLDTKV